MALSILNEGFSLSFWERVGVRVFGEGLKRRLNLGRRVMRAVRVSPLPNPLPGGEGVYPIINGDS
jgi:hypothetical protein